MDDWKLTCKEAGRREYRAPHGVVFQVATGGWMAIHACAIVRALPVDQFRHTARSIRAGVTSGAFRTASLAMRAVDGARDHERARAAKAEVESNYSAARRAGNEAGRAFFAGVQAGTMAKPESSSWAQGSLGEFARLSSAAHCGVFHGPRRAAYERAFCAGYRDAEFMAKRDAEETALENESAAEFAARRGRIAGRKDSGSGAPREARIEHLSYLDGLDSRHDKESFRAGYLATYKPVKESR